MLVIESNSACFMNEVIKTIILYRYRQIIINHKPRPYGFGIANISFN